MKIKAVFFDAGLTLFNVYPYSKSGMFKYFCSQIFGKDELDSLDLEQGAKRAEIHFQMAQKNKEYKRSEKFWIDNYAEGLMAAGLSKKEAYQLSPIMKEKVDKVQKKYSLVDGMLEILKELKRKGYLLAVVSNWRNQSLVNVLNDLGIDSYFDYIADSSVEGVSKPNPQIFENVLNALNIKNSEAIHVGDLYYSDILGANNSKIEGILYDELDTLGNVFKCKRICNMKELLMILEEINE